MLWQQERSGIINQPVIVSKDFNVADSILWNHQDSYVSTQSYATCPQGLPYLESNKYLEIYLLQKAIILPLPQFKLAAVRAGINFQKDTIVHYPQSISPRRKHCFIH